MTEPIIKDRLLPKFSVHKPVSVTMIFFAIIVIGFIAYTKIKVDLFPSGYSFTAMGVWIPYPNANPKEIEQQIVKPIEGQLKTVKNLKRVYSRSFTDGNWFWLEFSRKTNMDLAYAQVTDRLERCRPLIPDEIEHFYVRRFRENDDPVIYMALSYDKSVKDPNFLVTKYLKQALEGTKGIANVELWGFREKYFQVVINDDKIKAYGVNLSDLITKLYQDNFAISSGYVYYGSKKLLLRSNMRFKSIDDIENIRVREGILLKDIAEVKFDFDEDFRHIMRVNGKIASGVGIFKESNANTVEVCKLVKKKLAEQFARDELKGFEYYIFWNMGEAIQDSINNVQYTGLWGGLFAFFVLLFFLRRIKMTLMLSLAIPFSLLVTVIVMYFIGWTLNLITLMGMMISIGMVVDNAIVITENVYRFHNMGHDLKTSAVKGASEVGLAITLATLTTIVVFLPMMVMSGDDDFTFFMIRIGSPVIFALLGSLFIALVFIPLISTKVSGKKVEHKGIVQKTSTKYQKFLAVVLDHRLDTSIIIFFIIVSMMVPFKNMKKSNEGGGGPRDAFVSCRFPSYYSIEKSDSTLNYVASKILERDSIYHIKDIQTRTWGLGGRIEIYLHPDPYKQWYQVIYKNISKVLGMKVEERLSRTELSEDIKKHLPEIPGVRMRTTWQDHGKGGDKAIKYSLRGNDTDMLAEIAEELEKQLKLVEGVISVDNDIETGNDEVHVKIDREKANKAGVDPQYVSQYLAFNYRGRKISDFKAADREIPVYVKSDPEAQKSIHRLKNLSVRDNTGNETTLSSIADFEITKSIGRIKRENGKSFMEISIYTAEEDNKKVMGRVEKIMKNYKYPTGYSYEKGMSMRNMEEQDSQMQKALLLSVLFVFIIMGVLFESFILPLSVIIAIPAAFTGSFWLLFITGTTFEIMAGIGLVVLVGVVVNNAIVLIDMINQFRISGLSRRDAILEAAGHRFRPILMTALTTICGLMPMAIGNTSLIGLPYKPMGITMIGGLVSSTFLTLFAVPVLYTLLDDLGIFWKKLVNKF